MIMQLTFLRGLKHFTRSSGSFAISSNPIDARDALEPLVDPVGPRSYNS